MIGRCEHLEIDTKDICLLCLGSKVEGNGFDSPPNLPSLLGLKHFLRYLKVSPKELFNCSSEFLQSMEIREDIDLKITLCSICSSVTEKFNKLYHEYELIQLQFSDCVQSLHESISKGNENPELVRKYKDQMQPTKSADLVNASIAANLRSETLKKCSLKLQSAIPRVRVASQKGDVEAVGGNSISETQVPRFLANTRSRNDIDSDFGSRKPQTEIPIQSVSPGKSNFETCSKLPKADDVKGGSSSFSSKTQLPEPGDSFRRKTRSLNTNSIQSQFYNEYKKLNVPQESVLGNDPSLFLQTSISGKPLKINTNRKMSYFNSIRKKLKTKPRKKKIKDHLFGRRNIASCEYCEEKYTTHTLRVHLQLVHPEHFILKFLPSNISSELCNLGVQTVLEQMSAESGRKCQFCQINLCNISSLKCHLIGSHAELLAPKVLEHIRSSPELMAEIQNQNIQKPLPKLTEAVMATTSGSNTDNLSTNKVTTKTRFVCEHCDSFYFSSASLKSHKDYAHQEHIIYKLFPPHISLEACKQGVDFVFEQMLEQNSENGFKCKFCLNNVRRKNNLKTHVVGMHAEQFAMEALKYIGQLSEHLEVKSTGDCITLGNYEYENERINSPSEDINGSYQTSMALEMEFEEESLVKIEHPVSQNDEVDPLDVDFMD